MADLKLAFGLKKVGSSGTDIVSTNAHWFMDSFWTTTGSYDSDDNCYYRPVIKITNPMIILFILHQLNFRLSTVRVAVFISQLLQVVVM